MTTDDEIRAALQGVTSDVGPPAGAWDRVVRDGTRLRTGRRRSVAAAGAAFALVVAGAVTADVLRGRRDAFVELGPAAPGSTVASIAACSSDRFLSLNFEVEVDQPGALVVTSSAALDRFVRATGLPREGYEPGSPPAGWPTGIGRGPASSSTTTAGALGSTMPSRDTVLATQWFLHRVDGRVYLAVETTQVAGGWYAAFAVGCEEAPRSPTGTAGTAPITTAVLSCPEPISLVVGPVESRDPAALPGTPLPRPPSSSLSADQRSAIEATLYGRCGVEAMEIARRSGWTVRVVSSNRTTDITVTADLRADRIGLTLLDGKVVGIRFE